MKLFKYGLPFAALAILASCSNDNLDAPAGDNQTPAEPYTGLMMNLTIKIPSGTRAVSYDDGEKDEYNVKDGKLFLFSDSGTDGKHIPGNCVAVVNLPGWDGEGTQNNSNVTDFSSFTGLQMPTQITKTNYLALVILNTENMQGNIPAVNDAWDNWATSALQGGAKMISEDSKVFTMTNALGWIGGAPKDNDEPTVLVPILASDLYYASDTNKPSTPVSIYVQRGVAKITMDKNSPISILSEEDAETISKYSDVKDSEDKVGLTEWYLDNVNETTYPVQQLPATPDEFLNTVNIASWDLVAGNAAAKRFISTDVDFARFYWAGDANYGGTETPTAPAGTKNAVKIGENSDKEAFYCYENTFNLANMIQSQSTRLILKGVYSVGGEEVKDFISYNGLYMAIEEGDKVADSYPTESSTTATIKSLINEEKKDKFTRYFNIGDETPVNFHKDGVVYYQIINRHFTDEELGLCTAPADEGKWQMKFDTYAECEEPALNLLGRYGVVRNNWYDIKINSISGPGTPTPPDDPNTPDDPKAKLLLNVSVNILSWAQRKFGYDL